MFVLDFFTVYPDSVSERIIQKNCLTNIILALSLLPPYYSVTKELVVTENWWRHKSKSNRKTSVVITNQILFLDSILTQFNLNAAQRLPCSVYINSLWWTTDYPFRTSYRRPNTVTTWALGSLILWFLPVSAITV